MATEGNEARRVRYAGRVQGVGFRYTARRIAQGHAVTGYVRNLDDGRVELLAEGPKDEIARLLEAVSAAMGGNIRDCQEQSAAPTGRYASFEVTF